MYIKIKLIISLLIIILFTHCGPNYGYCECDNPNANKTYKWPARQLSQKKKVQKMCDDRATEYNTTCTLRINGSK